MGNGVAAAGGPYHTRTRWWAAIQRLEAAAGAEWEAAGHGRGGGGAVGAVELGRLLQASHRLQLQSLRIIPTTAVS